MERRFNPFDPLGIFGTIRREVDRIAASAKLPTPPGPPGMARRSEAERAARHAEAYGGAPPERGAGMRRLLDPLGLFQGRSSKGGSIGNPIPREFDGRLVDLKDRARQALIDRGYSPRMVDTALTWYDEWLMGMARRLAPGNPDLQRSVVQSAYEEIAPKAERWLAGIQEAFAL